MVSLSQADLHLLLEIPTTLRANLILEPTGTLAWPCRATLCSSARGPSASHTPEDLGEEIGERAPATEQIL